MLNFDDTNRIFNPSKTMVFLRIQQNYQAGKIASGVIYLNPRGNFHIPNISKPVRAPYEQCPISYSWFLFFQIDLEALRHTSLSIRFQMIQFRLQKSDPLNYSWIIFQFETMFEAEIMRTVHYLLQPISLFSDRFGSTVAYQFVN